jgi:hypothetical protein
MIAVLRECERLSCFGKAELVGRRDFDPTATRGRPSFFPFARVVSAVNSPVTAFYQALPAKSAFVRVASHAQAHRVRLRSLATREWVSELRFSVCHPRQRESNH